MIAIPAFLFIVFVHVMAFLALFLIKKISLNTVLFQIAWYILSAFGITAGYHRLWTHQTYDATPLFKAFLLFFGSSASEGSVINWTQYHRTHHRNEDHPGDPHDISKGFYFAHFGWTILNPDEETQRELNKTKVDDLKSDPLLVLQEHYYLIFWALSSVIIPVLICSLWNDAYNGFWSSFIRIILVLHATWCVNSFAHMFGDKPYNDSLAACENLFVAIISMGEGWHNYHHSYPKDYRTSEEDKYNPTAWLIDAASALGLAYDRHVKGDQVINKYNKFDKSVYRVI